MDFVGKRVAQIYVVKVQHNLQDGGVIAKQFVVLEKRSIAEVA